MSRIKIEPITLDQFMEIERRRLAEFERQWREAMAANPVHFPNSMGEGDWFEQLVIFDDEAAPLLGQSPDN